MTEASTVRKNVRRRVRKARTVDDLYALIPPVPCIEGCTDCCGVAPFAGEEARRVNAALAMRGADWAPGPSNSWLPARGGTPCTTCPFANRGCDIHGDRPITCRLFGAVEGERRLQCPHGRIAEDPLSAAEARLIMRRYEEFTAGAQAT